jgi:sulfite reductase (ferredoxin)
MLDEFVAVPSYEEDPSFYSDWGDPREYTIGDMGEGESAGEVVSTLQIGLAASEREVFEAQVLLDEGHAVEAGQRAYSAMLQAARALGREKNPNLGDDATEIVSEFRAHYYDTKLFFDPYAGGKFAQYFFKAHDEAGSVSDAQGAHQLIEEAQLFVDAAHQVTTRIGNVMP